TGDVRVSGDWLDRLLAASAPTPFNAVSLGGADPRVLVYGPGVRTLHTERVTLPLLEGITWPGAGSGRPQTETTETTVADSRKPAAATTISAVLIVKDEQDVLAECLDALRPEVDEVVVYDTGSRD